MNRETTAAPSADTPKSTTVREPAEQAHSSGHSDPIEAALAAGIAAIAASMATAAPRDLVVLAERMAALSRELEARRTARAGNVVTLDAHRRSR